MAFSTSTAASFWNSLPNEMKYAIVENLDINDARSLSRVDRLTYGVCVPATFKTVKLLNYNQVERFLESVPRSYYQHILDLDVCTANAEDHMGVLDIEPPTPRVQADAIIALLLAAPRLTKLSLRMAGSLDSSAVASFSHLRELRNLTIANCASDDVLPLSERLVVSIAASLPKLEQLSLDRISRSKMHAPELEGTNPFLPLVVGDDDIPAHPRLGSELSLPSLLTIPTLRKLQIRDTHLGDPRWSTTPVSCHLEMVDLGSCYHENDDFNRICIERIMSAVGRTVDEFSLATSVSDSAFAKPTVTPLPRLRKLHVSPFFQVENVVETMSNLAGSPIESLSMQCFEDDVVDVCAALEEFLSLKVERGPEFYNHLKRIDVSVAASEFSCYDEDEEQERIAATQRLQEFCRDLQLSSVVQKANCESEGTTSVSASGGIRNNGGSADDKLASAMATRANLLG